MHILFLYTVVFQTQHGQIIKLFRILCECVNRITDGMKNLLRVLVCVFIEHIQHPVRGEHFIISI